MHPLKPPDHILIKTYSFYFHPLLNAILDLKNTLEKHSKKKMSKWSAWIAQATPVFKKGSLQTYPKRPPPEKSTNPLKKCKNSGKTSKKTSQKKIFQAQNGHPFGAQFGRPEINDIWKRARQEASKMKTKRKAKMTSKIDQKKVPKIFKFEATWILPLQPKRHFHWAPKAHPFISRYFKIWGSRGIYAFGVLLQCTHKGFGFRKTPERTIKKRLKQRSRQT